MTRKDRKERTDGLPRFRKCAICEDVCPEALCDNRVVLDEKPAYICDACAWQLESNTLTE